MKYDYGSESVYRIEILNSIYSTKPALVEAYKYLGNFWCTDSRGSSLKLITHWLATFLFLLSTSAPRHTLIRTCSQSGKWHAMSFTRPRTQDFESVSKSCTAWAIAARGFEAVEVVVVLSLTYVVRHSTPPSTDRRRRDIAGRHSLVVGRWLTRSPQSWQQYWGGQRLSVRFSEYK